MSVLCKIALLSNLYVIRFEQRRGNRIRLSCPKFRVDVLTEL